MIYTITKDCNSKTPYPYRVTGPGAVDISYSHSIMQMKVYIVDCVINTQVDFNLNKYKGPIKSILIKNEIFNKPVIFDAQDLLKIWETNLPEKLVGLYFKQSKAVKIPLKAMMTCLASKPRVDSVWSNCSRRRSGGMAPLSITAKLRIFRRRA